ncbi:putative lipoprotein [Citreicella sp. SE45]|nr:putative lipoprotein [Citreicella sp. SE45]MAU44511.1 argininosuccinate lyase [Salipiger sp.]MAU47567.1 argininosuccinate lyase [Salipiger sp.]
MRTILTLGVVALLAACGADGEPIAPEKRETPEPGIRISGAAEIGVSSR